MKIETLAVHAGREIDSVTGAVQAPIQLSTTFRRDQDGELASEFIYSRSGNPTRRSLEKCLASLEEAAECAAFSSGMAVANAVFQALEPGAHVIISDGYYGTGKMLVDVFTRWKVECSIVDTSDISAFRSALRNNTQLVWIESPTNPMIRVTDLAEVSALSHAAGAKVICDNTVPTAILQRPLDHGCDMSMYSATKFLSGHGDVLGGALVSKNNDEFFERVRLIQTSAGAVPSPFECWLTLRGIRTLPYRVRAHSENAMKVAMFLDSHPAIAGVNYPGLPKNKHHSVAKKQMTMFGGLLSIHLKGGRDAAMQLAARVRLFTRATSLGGTESLIEHRASVEAPPAQTPEDLLRLSIGLEHPDDLIADLEQALA
ncbi:MAG: PLP-dependent transferase [Gemmatimonadaceae bacterium]|nr:PLP-dependent transferase [Gemmatimonadaceae bacterium]